MFDIHAQPTGSELQAFRCSIWINGTVCTQQQLADSIGTTADRIHTWEVEKGGTLMPAPWWTLTRITWDALALAEFQKIRPKRDQ
jgi:hypothetical protein